MDLKRRCTVERRNHKYLVAFFRRYPFLVAEVRYLRYKWPIDWWCDPVPLVVRKLLRQLLAWRPVLYLMGRIWGALRGTRLPLGIRNWLYWSVLGSHQMMGLRDGLQTCGRIRWPVREA